MGRIVILSGWLGNITRNFASVSLLYFWDANCLPLSQPQKLKTMKTSFILFSALFASSYAFVHKSKNDLTCSICLDIITDLDNFITSDTTEDQIVAFAKEICHTLGSLLGASLEAQCNAFMEAQLPGIIDQIVMEDINPQQICISIGLCP